ncbi:maleylacetoacetate isomerase [Nordella sp. HKS 07]|uniref:maleylacetoacetate isomerase n=1 Tax=Nordella sp. HKS 07 TaxID=2712222 RepID=UPI0013E1E0B5|nr:maleylacetoacetate isomerase [Nordella sp. HKS 07]QIG48549.1 maleylacetoacetate isomerase [Nordella sp. HKS 07]
MKLHDYFRSSAAYRVRIALNLKGVKVEQIAVHLVKDGGRQHSPEYKAKNPQGLVPALELDDGTVLIQSLAIIDYLETIAPEPRLIPADPVLAAKSRAVALAIACDIHPLNNLRVLNYLKGPLKHTQQEVDEWYRHWIRDGGLDAVERMIDGERFCFGDRPSLADICLIPQVFNARRYKIDITHLSKIAAVESHCTALAAFAAAHPARQPDAE